MLPDLMDFTILAQASAPGAPEMAPGAPETTLPISGSTTVPPVDEAGRDPKIKETQSDPVMSLLIFAGGLYFLKMWWDDTVNARRGDPHPKALPGTTECGWGWVGLAAAGSVGLVLISTLVEVASGMSARQSDTIWLALLGWVGAAFIEEILVRGYGGSLLEHGKLQFILGPLGFAKPTPVPARESAGEIAGAAVAVESVPGHSNSLSADLQGLPPVDEASAEVAGDARSGKPKAFPRPPSPATFRELLPGIVVLSVIFSLLHQNLWNVEFPDAEGVGSFTRFLRGTYSWQLGEFYNWWTTLALFANSVFWFYVRYSSKNPERSLLPCFAGHAAANAAVFFVKLAQGHVVGVWAVPMVVN